MKIVTAKKGSFLHPVKYIRAPNWLHDAQQSIIIVGTLHLILKILVQRSSDAALNILVISYSAMVISSTSMQSKI